MLRFSTVRVLATRQPLARLASTSNIRYVHRQDKSAEVSERYRAKLEKKAKEVGAKDISDLKEKLKDDIEKHNKAFAQIDPLEELEQYEREQAMQAQEKAKLIGKVRDPLKSDAPTTYKTLNSFVDLEKVKELPQKELELIWKARFDGKENSLISVVPKDVYERLYKNARENPNFVLPLPREGAGLELHYIQWSFVGPNTVHLLFTSLLEFKTHKEFARPHTSLIFHTELKDSKGLVFMNGIVEKESSVRVPEAQLLLLNVQRFYGALQASDISKRRLQLVKDFTSGNPNFSVDALIEEAQSLEN
jgi:ATP synthase F1 complex assembly factor 1